MRAYELIESFSSAGVFWDATAEDQPLSATLIYDPADGIQLHAAAKAIAVEKFFSFGKDAKQTIDTMFGVLSDGTPCRLINVQMVKNPQALSHHGVAIATPVFRVNFVFLGEASQEDPPVFDEMHIDFDALQHVSGIPRIFPEMSDTEVTVRFPAYAEPLLRANAKGVGIEIRFHRRLSIGHAWQAEGSYSAVVSVIPASPEPFDFYSEWIGDALGFVTLLAGVHAPPRAVSVIRRTGPDDKRPRSVYALFRYMHDLSAHTPRIQAAVTIMQLGEKAAEIATKWFESSEDEMRVFKLYLGTLYADAFVESQFLSLAQALESFHRVFRHSATMSEKVFAELKAVLRAALAGVPLDEDLKERISESFEFLAEPSFHTRMVQLLDGLSVESRGAIVRDRDGFIRTLKQTRNYLTHPGIKKKAAVLDRPVSFVYFNRRLQALLRLLIFLHLGAEESSVLEYMTADLLDEGS